tara:strand:+ start:580 stop:903 length:324 start_codon:yes stop_codon:yes gene_type:complete
MILVRFGRWNSSTGRILVWTRIYTKNGKWTPFCKVRRRYDTWFQDYRVSGNEKLDELQNELREMGKKYADITLMTKKKDAMTQSDLIRKDGDRVQEIADEIVEAFGY